MAGGAHDEMKMRGAPRMAAPRAQQVADRAVVGHGVGAGAHRGERVTAVVAGSHRAAQVVRVLRGVLLPVEAARRGLPEVECRAADRRARVVEYAAAHQHRFARILAHEVAAERQPHRALRVKRSERAVVGRARAGLQQIDERRQAQHVGSQYELISALVGNLAGAVQEVDGGVPFIVSEIRLAREIVQVRDQARDDEFETFVGRAGERRDDGGGDVVTGDVAHAQLSVGFGAGVLDHLRVFRDFGRERRSEFGGRVGRVFERQRGEPLLDVG